MRAGATTWRAIHRARRLLLLALLVPVATLAGTVAASAAVLTVNTTKDEITPHDGKCSLREAVDATNSPGTKTDCGVASATSNLILLGGRKYVLSIPPATGNSDKACLHPTKAIDSNDSGALCVTTIGTLTIAGRGPATEIVGGPSLDDRLMTIARKASVSLVALKMSGGRAPEGADGTDGAIACRGMTTPTATPPGNGANGGAIYNAGALFTNQVVFARNSAGMGGSAVGTSEVGCRGGSGGAIYNDGTDGAGSLTLSNTTFRRNQAGVGGAGSDAGTPDSLPGGDGGAGGSGGAIANKKGSVIINDSTFLDNDAGRGGTGGTGDPSGGNGGTGGAGGPGGGIFSTGGSLDVTNSTFNGNSAGSGGTGGNGAGGGNGGNGGAGGSAGGVAVTNGASGLLNVTLASNAAGSGGAGGSGNTAGGPGKSGIAGGVFAQSSTSAHNMRLQNTIVASSVGSNCLGSPASAIANGGHNLSFGDTTCPASTNGDPRLAPIGNFGGYSLTMALERGSAAINKVPRRGAACPSTDERGVSRPQGPACDIGAFEFALPKISIDAPRDGARYKRGSRVLVSYRCSEGGITSPVTTPIVTCKGTVGSGRRLNTSKTGKKTFTVLATDRSGNKSKKTVHYTVVR